MTSGKANSWNPQDQVLAEFPRERGEVLIVSISKWRGQERFSIRVWYREGEDLLPTKRGVSLRPDEEPQIMELMARHLEPDSFED